MGCFGVDGLYGVGRGRYGERVAGLDGGGIKIIEAHGTFHTSHCIDQDCRAEYSQEWIRG